MILRPATERKRRHGATAVEMAFVLSIALLLMFGIIEYSRFVYFLHVAQNAAREAARFAVVRTGNVVVPADVNTIKGSMSDVASYQTGTLKWSSSSTIRGVVNMMMPNGQNMLSGYNVDAYYASQTTGLPINGTVATSNWSDAPFGGDICVSITGTYQFYAFSLLKLNSGGNMNGNGGLAVTVREFMSSEAN